MGALAVMRYPTVILAGLADHTYVQCRSGGKGWRCWGGKTGGTELNSAAGSTNQANEIAELDEKAGIRCYLINGVCHQSANRILFAAGITAEGARGYEVSEALFGTYGRPRGPLGTCPSPFDRHEGVTGDLPECAEAASAKRAAGRKTQAPRLPGQRQAERRYIRDVLAVYRQVEGSLTDPARTLSGRDLERFQLRLFLLQVRYRLGSRVSRTTIEKLRDIRLSTERARMKIEEWFANREMRIAEFAQAFNSETILFQENVARVLKRRQYKALFGLEPGDHVILADPRVIRQLSRADETR